jgi:hypothetical protein
MERSYDRSQAALRADLARLLAADDDRRDRDTGRKLG